MSYIVCEASALRGGWKALRKSANPLWLKTCLSGLAHNIIYDWRQSGLLLEIFSVFIMTVELWNSLPSCAKVVNSRSTFNTSLISIYLPKCVYSKSSKMECMVLATIIVFRFYLYYRSTVVFLYIRFIVVAFHYSIFYLIVAFSCISRGSDCNWAVFLLKVIDPLC